MKKKGYIAALALVIWGMASVSLHAQNTVEDWYIKGEEYYQKGDYQNAINAYTEGIKKAETINISTSMINQGGIDVAQVTHQWTADEINCYWRRGYAYYRLQNWDAALANFQVVEREYANPRDYHVLSDVGDAYGRKGEYEQAVSYWERYLKWKPADEPLNYNITKSYQGSRLFCATLWKLNILDGNPRSKYEKWITDICRRNSLSRNEIEAFYNENRGF